MHGTWFILRGANDGLRDRIQRAALSSTLAPDASAGVTNIAEGFDCESKAEFERFLDFARRLQTFAQEIDLNPEMSAFGAMRFAKQIVCAT